MFTQLGHFVVRRRRAVLTATILTLFVAVAVGTGVFGRLSTGGFADPAAESTTAADILDEEFATGTADLVLVVTATDGDVDSAASTEAGLALTATVASTPGTADVVSYWSAGAPPLRSADGTRALLLLRFPGGEDDPTRAAAVDTVLEEHTGFTEAGLEVEPAGEEAVFAEVGETIEGDLARAEAIAIPLTLLLLLVVFGGVVAAGLPVLVGMVSVFGAFLVLFAVTQFTDVSIFSINLVTALGLGLAIDYSLFIVSRFREERQNGRTVEQAVIRTVETAGRTVAFSAMTVAISLSALLVFPLYFLRSFAYAGVGVILVSMVISVVSLPALLAVLGRRVDAWRIPGRRADRPSGNGWHRLATLVMRRPIVVAVAGVLFLVALGVPFLRVEWGVPDDRVLPASADSRVASEIVRSEFDSAEGNALPIVARGGVDDPAVSAYAEALSRVDGIARVDASTGRYVDGRRVVTDDPALARFAASTAASGDATWFNVVPTVEPISSEGEAMVAQLRGLEHDFGEVLVGGQSASFVDSKEAIFSRVPLAAGLIVVATFVLLFLMFGSLLVPLKAIVLNTLSLTATFGLLVWVFQDGNGAGLLGFTPTGLTDTSMPILMFCVAFGLSMDYEVFLLSRMKEEHDRTGDNDLAVAMGLEKTGRLVTAAALLLSITFFAFATSGVTFITMFGLGLAVAVLVDAFIVRSTLVPALMKLAGEWNWWAPAPLRRLHARIGISESVPMDVVDSDPEADTVSVPVVEEHAGEMV